MSSADMKRLGIEQGGESVSDELKVLVTGIAAFLAGLGLIELDDSELECSVSEVFDGIVAQIGCCKENEVRTSAVYTFKSVGELCDFCTCFPSAVLEKVVSSELYRLGSGYALCIDIGCSQTYLMSYKSMFGGCFDRVGIQKAREYGELISRTPIEAIRKLKDP